MNPRAWIFSLLTAVVLFGAALVFAYLLLWGMENHKASVKPYAFMIFGAVSLLIIIAAAVFAGAMSGWAAGRLFPSSGAGSLLLSLGASVLAVIVGFVSMFITVPTILSYFDDPIPRFSSFMRVQFPEKTDVIFHRNESGDIWNHKLIVKLDRIGWEEFRHNDTFAPDPLNLTWTEESESLRDWQTFVNAEDEAHVYRWMNHNESQILKVLARQAGDDEIYVYMYLLRNTEKGMQLQP